MRTPSIFKPFDALSMLLPCLVGVLATVLTLVYTTSTEAKVLTAVVTLCFIGISARTLQLRYAFIASYPLHLDCNVYVRLNGYKGTKESLNKEIARLISLYTMHFVNASTLLSQEPVWVEFLPDVITLNTRRVAGYATGDTVKVSYYRRLEDGTTTAWAEAPVERTAFAHELAHVIIGRETGGWDNSTHHALMEKIERV